MSQQKITCMACGSVMTGLPSYLAGRAAVRCVACGERAAAERKGSAAATVAAMGRGQTLSSARSAAAAKRRAVSKGGM